jgi:hypothetical protein
LALEYAVARTYGRFGWFTAVLDERHGQLGRHRRPLDAQLA